jgi:hypothetical protein
MKLIIHSVVFYARNEILGYFLLLCMLLPTIATAQDDEEDINSEYRITFVPTYPINKKLFLTSYLGYVKVPSTGAQTYYVGAPLLVTYRPNQVIELMAGAFVVINNLKTGDDNVETRPLAGVKFSLPNAHHLNIFSWTRYEYRSFNYDVDSLDNVKNRLRSRVGIEFPLSKNAWAPKTYYGFTDFEMFYTIEKGYFDRFRERLGIGYVLDAHWKVEFIYHIQMLKKSKDLNPEWTDNIFRLNIKWSIPHKIHGPIAHPPDVEE